MTSARYSVSTESVAVAQTNPANSSPINYGDFESGMIYVPAGSPLTTLKWWVSTKIDGTYLEAENAASAALTQTVAGGQAHPIPSDLSGARFLKITGNAAGEVGITLKD